MLWLRALASFLACPAMVAGLVPMLFVREHTPYAPWLPLSAFVLGIGIFALLWCVRDFYVSGRGTLAPWDPPKRLVIVGLYRFVRNPMGAALSIVAVARLRHHRGNGLSLPRGSARRAVAQTSVRDRLG
jgi:protein-S-isoprenylcysteine O-methyltransferase Ste14